MFGETVLDNLARQFNLVKLTLKFTGDTKQWLPYHGVVWVDARGF